MSRGRVPSAVAIDRYSISEHDLIFHKPSNDDSGKCDVYFTAKADDIIYGFLSKVDPDQKPALDKAEGLGFGYGQKRGGGHRARWSINKNGNLCCHSYRSDS